MPKGIPNKKDGPGMKYTSFHVPPTLNPKQLGTSYLKSESQTLWYRNSVKKAKARAAEGSPPEQRPRGSQVLVIHPGSSCLRIGKACDTSPIEVPNVIARRHKPPIPEPYFHRAVTRPLRKTPHQSAENSDVITPPEDPMAHIESQLLQRMKFYKLRVTPDARELASTFNAAFKPEIIPERNDPFRIQWLDESCQDDILIGDRAFHLADPAAAGYVVRRPIRGPTFNTRDYPSLQVILSDIEDILRSTLSDKLGIEPSDYQSYSVVLIIPDLYDRVYVRCLVNLLLISMGFKQLCAQQESLAAAYGAGISSACVVDIGAKTTSVSCVDEGLVVAESRLLLNMGGDDVTEFLYAVLTRINFPYREIDLARSYDWNVMEDLKKKICTLSESDVALNLYDFVVRKPGQPVEKYSFKAYDEVILAPMCIFEPKVIEFDVKCLGLHPISHPDVTEEILEHQTHYINSAMVISTQHLISEAPVSATVPVLVVPKKADDIQEGPSDTGTTGSPMDASQTGGDVVMAEVPPEDQQKPSASQVAEATPANSPAKQNHGNPTQELAPAFGGVDVFYEASKLPLDVAVYNSARALGDDKIPKYLSAVMIIGGGSLVSGMAHALQSRLNAILTDPFSAPVAKAQVIPPPKDVDRRVQAWKGAAVLGKMEGTSELWVTTADWDLLGMRGLKERCFFL